MYLGPVPEYLRVNSAARRFLTVAGVEGKFLSSFLYLLTRSLTIFGSAGIFSLRRVEITLKTSTNITQYLYSRGPVRQVFSQRASDKLD